MSAEKIIHVVAGIIRQHDRLLIALRPDNKPYSGFWEFPGGKVEEGELSLDALKRELHEELGIAVTTADHWFNHRYRYPDKTVFLEVWLVSDFSGEPHGKEGQQLSWVTFSELQTLRMLEGNWGVVDRMKEFL
jgi:8-oxo-dGTP diphosphatase